MNTSARVVSIRAARLFAIAATAAVFAALAGCASLGSDNAARPIAAAQHSSREESQRDRLNDGYSALYSTAQGLSEVDKLLYVKVESDDVQKVVDGVSAYNGRLVKRLQGLAGDFPALDLRRTVMPPIVKAAYAAQKNGSLKRFAPVVGESGKAFERGLLIRLLGGVDTQRYLAQALAEREPDPALKKIMSGAAKRYVKLFDKINALLKKRFYR